MATIDDRARTRLARDVEAAVKRASPEWTSSNAHDPGVTLIELFAFLGESLLYRMELSETARRAAIDLAGRISALVPKEGEDDCGDGPRRNRYYVGQLLGVEDFETEQTYLRDRLDRRNRALGAGIVGGLAVTVESDGSGQRVVIAPGLAVAPDGKEIGVDRPCPLALPASGTTLLVQVAYREVPCRPVPSPSTTGSGVEFSRIVETFAASLVETADANAVTLARLQRRRGGWRVDRAFAPPRRPC